MSWCFRESVVEEDGTCAPATSSERTAGEVSNAEVQARMSLPSVASLGEAGADGGSIDDRWGAGAAAALGDRSFVAEVFAEDRADRAARGENWLELPFGGAATGRIWAEERRAAFARELDQARVRAQQLHDNHGELVHTLTDADVVGRWMNDDDSRVARELAAADRAHSRALAHIVEAQAHNDLAPDHGEHTRRQATARRALQAAWRAIEQGERILGAATEAAEGKAGTYAAGLGAVETLSRSTFNVALTLATGGQSLALRGLAAALAAGGWETVKQESELARKGRPLTDEDRAQARARIDWATGMGALGAALPGSDAGFAKDAAFAGLKGAGVGMVDNAGRQLIGGHSPLGGAPEAGAKGGSKGVLGLGLKGAVKGALKLP